MHRLLRAIQTSSCHGLSTRARPGGSSGGSGIPRRAVAPIGAAAFVACGAAILLHEKKPEAAETKVFSLKELKAMCEQVFRLQIQNRAFVFNSKSVFKMFFIQLQFLDFFW